MEKGMVKPVPGESPARRLIAAGAVVLIAVLAVLAPPSSAEIKEQIIAVVNDDIITFSELDKMLSPIFEQYERIYSGAELFSMLQKARHDILEHLIEQKLILQEAKRQNIREQMGDDFSKEVERGVERVKSAFPSEEAFLAKLKRDGMTSSDFMAMQEEQALIRGILLKEVYSHCSVSPGEVKDYYEKHTMDFTEKEKIHVSQIWIKAEPGNEKEARKKAEDILAKLDAGGSFAELARKYSDGPYASRGGDWGFISRGHWNSILEKAAFDLKPGRHSGVIISPLGAHIILLHERKPPTAKPLNEVYQEIEKKLFEKKASARREEWITSLKRKAYISIMK